MSRFIFSVSVGVVLGLGACASKPPPEEPKPAQPASGSESTSQSAAKDDSLAGHMQANFRLGLEMRDAVIQGNLQLAQQKARDLGWQDYRKVLPAHWMDGVAKMQAAARTVAEARDLAEASQHVAELAATCGDCHARLPRRAQDAEQEHGFSAKGPEDIQTRMARHERAADGMWFGLSIPSDASWRVGARALTEAPLSAPQVEGKPVDPALGAKMEAVRDIGRRALEAEQAPDRIKVFGELISSCAGCHARQS
ncbi:MAG: hypothetical protein ACHQ53_13680 [Polyangiales bacterium]